MQSNRPISIDLTVKEFLRVARMQNHDKSGSSFSALLFDLLSFNCDYYDLLDLFTEYPLHNDCTQIFQTNAPPPQATVVATEKNIRELFYRWTPSKYHTGPIASVVRQVYRYVSLSSEGVHIFNSNNNPRNNKNEKYVLIISKTTSLFFDVKRKHTLLLIPEGGKP